MHEPVTNALSVDLEEYYHALIFQRGTAGQAHGTWESRVEGSLDRILALFAGAGVRGTFFTVGEVAAAHPAMMRRLADAGHEVGCHSHRHHLVSTQTPAQFREDVRRAKGVLEELTGGPVIGFRAPNYSIGREQSWAWEILLDEGFRYDSSIYPIHHDTYGDPDAPRFPYPVFRRGDDVLTEFPIGTARVLGQNLPIGGGGYFRLFPAGWFRRAIDGVNRRERKPVMFYFHPWDMDPGQPRPPMPLMHTFRHRVNLERFEGKLAGLLARVRFAPVREVLGLGAAA